MLMEDYCKISQWFTGKERIIAIKLPLTGNDSSVVRLDIVREPAMLFAALAAEEVCLSRTYYGVEEVQE